jgi:hypothetical protein
VVSRRENDQDPFVVSSTARRGLRFAAHSRVGIESREWGRTLLARSERFTMLHTQILSRVRTTLIGFAVVAGVVVVSHSMASATAEPVWGDGTLAEFAPGALQTEGFGEVGSVSCWSPGNCVAVGGFSATNNGNFEPFTITSTNGVWGTPREAVFASGLQAAYSESGFESVSCPSANNCTVTGLTNGTTYTFTVSASHTSGSSDSVSPPASPSGQAGTSDSPLPTTGASYGGGTFALWAFTAGLGVIVIARRRQRI